MRGWKLLSLLMIGVFMGALDLTVLAPALPAMAQTFSVTPAAIILVFSIYAAFYAATIPLMSKLSDLRGYKPVFGWSLVLFTAGSAGAALAPNLPVLVLSRLVQGIGGGGLFPVAQAIAGAAYPEHRQGKVFALLLGTFAAGAVIGPNLGGLLVQGLSWHWIFWINVPLGLFALVLTLQVSLPDRRRRLQIDWLGAILVAWTFGTLVLGIESLRHLHTLSIFSVRVGGLLLAALAGAIVLVLVERRQEEPILDVRLIATATIAPALAVSFLIGFALLSAVVMTPLYVQLRFEATSLGSGAVLNAAALGLGVSAWVAAAFTNRWGTRRLVILGMVSSAMGIAVMAALSYSVYGVLSGLLFLGLGLGLAQGPLSQLSLALAPPDDHGQVAGFVSIMRSMGAATGITTAAVFLSTAASRIPLLPQSEILHGLDVEGWGSAGSLQALRQAPAAVQDSVRGLLSAGVLHGWHWALGAAVLGLLISLRLRG